MDELQEQTETETVTIDKETYVRLVENEKTLYALQGAGVDNWDGYDYAMETLDQERWEL